ncbi:MAG TPA: fluoride efflux transporter CrcB [Ilumatobacter sp.]
MSNAAWLAFLAAAAIGAPLRYLIDGIVQAHTKGVFPWGTFVVNISGCFMMGILTGLALYHDLAITSRTVLGSGGIGAYTTFSTFTFETVRLAEEGAVNEALGNAAASFLVGLAAASAGLAVTAVL